MHSQRTGFLQHLLAKRRGQITWRQHIYPYTQQFLEVDLDAPQIEEGCTGQGIDQQIKVAFLGVFAAQNRAEYAWPCRAVGSDNLQDSWSVLPEQLGRNHCLAP